jgi:hypothetical protein
MTNTIKAKHLTPGVRFIDPEGNVQTTVRARMIDSARVRVETKEGVHVMQKDETFALDE